MKARSAHNNNRLDEDHMSCLPLSLIVRSFWLYLIAVFSFILLVQTIPSSFAQGDANDWVSRGVSLGKNGTFEEALFCFEKAIALDENMTDAWYFKAFALQEMGKLDEALNAYSKTLKIDPDYIRAWRSKGLTLMSLGRFQEALHCLNKTLEIHDLSPDDWCQRGVILTELGRFDDALDCFNHSLQLNPSFADAWYNKGKAYGRMGARFYRSSFEYNSTHLFSPRYIYDWMVNVSLYSDQGMHEVAIECYDEALRINSEFAEASVNKGFELMALERFNESLECFDGSLNLNPKIKDAWLGKGDLLRHLGRFDEALNCYDEALKIAPNYPLAFNRMGTLLYVLGSYDKAVDCFDEALKIDPLFTWSWNNKGLVLRKLGRTAEALGCLDRAIELDPYYIGAQVNRGTVLSDLERYEDALDAYRIAFDLCPVCMVCSLYDTQPNSGDALVPKGRFTESIEAYDQTILSYIRYLGPGERTETLANHSMYWMSMGYYQSEQGDNENALFCYDRVIDENHLDAVAWMKKGQALMMLNRLDDALKSFDIALQVNPHYVDAWYGKGDVLQALGRYGEGEQSLMMANRTAAGLLLDEALRYEVDTPLTAIDYCDLALRLDPDYVDAWYDKAILLCMLSRWDEGAECYGEVVRIQPADVEALTARGQCLGFMLQRASEGAICLQEALKVNPFYAYAKNSLGVLLSGSSLKQYEQAIECFGEVINVKPRMVEAWLNKGNLLFFTGRFSEAVACFDQALAISSSRTDAWVGKGIALYLAGNYSEAVKCCNQALAINRSQSSALRKKAIDLSLKGNQTEAEQLLEQASSLESIDLNDWSVTAWRIKGMALARTGKYDEALNCFDKASLMGSLSDSTCSTILVCRGDVLWSMERRDEALGCFEKANELDPFGDALVHKADCLGVVKMYDEALRCYDEDISANSLKWNLSWSLWLKKGRLLAKMCLHKDAIECFDKALALDERVPDAWEMKNQSLNVVGRYSETAECIWKRDFWASQPREKRAYQCEEGFSIYNEMHIGEPLKLMSTDSSGFYDIVSYAEIIESYDFLRRYYELDKSIEPNLNEMEGKTYLCSFDGGFFMPVYRWESSDDKVNAFDCSEMAALTEYYLERSGIKARIAISVNLTSANGETIAATDATPSESNFTHAFVLLDLPGGPYFIDPSRPDFNRSENLMLIGPEDSEYDKSYYHYDHIYDNIYDLISVSHYDLEGRLLDQFDWWNSKFFIEEIQHART